MIETRKIGLFIASLALSVSLILLPIVGFAAPGAILFSDNFNDG